jgi:y4mF family transcriptional regulator
MEKTMQSNGKSPHPLDESQRLGKALRARRRALGLGQAEVCALSGVGPAFVYQLEHGKPTVRLDKLLDVLAVLGLTLVLQEGKTRLGVDPALGDEAP